MDTARALRDVAASLDARVRSLDAELAALRAQRASEHADDEHDPDGVTLSAEWSRLEGLRDDAVRERLDLDAAFVRVAEGTYGICVGCGRTIPAARLEVRPAAVRCVACATDAGA